MNLGAAPAAQARVVVTNYALARLFGQWQRKCPNRDRGDYMRGLAALMLASAIGIGLTTTAPKMKAQVSVEVGPAPVCPYGYYDVAPYNCAPYGYYGPEWFSGGVFIGAGPWFHGRENFRGHVDTRYHPEHGYNGRLPERGEKATRPVGKIQGFHGNERRDGRGHVK
jgi:hypothetical protein